MNRLMDDNFKEQLQMEMKAIEKDIKRTEKIQQKAIREKDQWLVEDAEKRIQQGYRDMDIAKTEYVQIYGGA